MRDPQKPNIIIIDNSRAVTGAYKSIVGLVEELASTFNFHFCLPSNSETAKRIRDKGYSLLELPFIEISKSFRVLLYFPILLWNTFILLRYIRKHQIQVVHVNDVYNMCGVMVKLFNKKIKLVYHVRLMPESYIYILYNQFVAMVSKQADAIIAVSSAVKNALIKRGVDAILIYDCIIIHEKYPPRSHDEHSSPLSLLYLSNFIPGKGHVFAINAFAIAQKQNPSIKLIMAGGDLGLAKSIQMKKQLIQLVSELGMKEKIVFSDFVEDVELIFKSSDIVLNFSESESFSMTCLEALTYGTPLIATDSGGPKELFEHERSGLLVPNRDVEAMAAAIIRLSGDRNLRASFAKAGREYVSKKFSQKKSAHTLSAIYTQINH